MHELSVALSILDVAAEEVERRQLGRVLAIHLQLGQLSGVVREALLSAFALARTGSPLAEAELVIEDGPVLVECLRCQARRSVVSIQELCCSECGTPAANVISGRELAIVALEVE